MPFDRALQFTFTFTLFLNYRGAFSEKGKANFSKKILPMFGRFCDTTTWKAAIKIHKPTNKLKPLYIYHIEKDLV